MPWLLILRSPWIWVGLLVLGLGTWGGLEEVRLGLCQDELKAAKQENAALRDRIKLQNDAVDRLKAEWDKKVADAAKGLQDATRATQAAVGEAARLKALAARQRVPDKPRPDSCPPSGADRAVTTIREGLK